MSEKTLQTLRDQLFSQLEELSDTSKPIDVTRHRLRVQVSQAIIDASRLEVELAAILKGALEVPFIEAGSVERPALPPHPDPQHRASMQSASPMERTAQALAQGPAPHHPWRPKIERS